MRKSIFTELGSTLQIPVFSAVTEFEAIEGKYFFFIFNHICLSNMFIFTTFAIFY